MRKTIIILASLAMTTSALATEFPHSKQKQCGIEWKAAKDASEETKKAGWPAYWSTCATRYKATKDTFTKGERKLTADDVIRVQRAMNVDTSGNVNSK